MSKPTLKRPVLVFVDGRRRVLSARRMRPQADVFAVPAGTAEAWEAKAGGPSDVSGGA